MNATPASIGLQDHGDYSQVLIGPGRPAESAYASLVAELRAGPIKPLIVVLESSREDLDFWQAFNLGMALAGLNTRIAVVFSPGGLQEAARFTELVARNRGAQVRVCDDMPSAKAWLGVGP